MTKAGKFWILAVIMGILGLVEAVTGFVLWLGFPAGGNGACQLNDDVAAVVDDDREGYADHAGTAL